ncbi:MAG TPA: helix-turn-helix transcriptional regulator [Candidatus Baltobacteraceae bacterium]|jgi:DNA-binding CsgD family transcriptional regulator|nr:helix-turn-helix transcriptional regulator [Candidatus Baltobacteraceae bacterium]
MSLKAGTGHRESPRLPHAIKQRARPRLLLVDDDLRIVQYEAAALALLDEMCGLAETGRLPAPVETAVVKAVRDIDEQHHHATVMPVPALIIHISRVHGSDRSFFALMLERASRRAPVASAVRRYSLTNREREVLELIMRGLHAPDIATELSISPTTVTGYFKGLLRKTESKSRAEMIAKVLGWDEGDAHAPHS